MKEALVSFLMTLSMFLGGYGVFIIFTAYPITVLSIPFGIVWFIMHKVQNG